jgi:hypothetical protein
MTAVMDKAKVSGIAGAVSALATLFSPYNVYFIFVGFGMFLMTLLIQYGSLKIKLVASMTGILLFLATYFVKGGMLP